MNYEYSYTRIDAVAIVSSHCNALARLAGRLPAGITLMVLAALCGTAAGVGAWFLKFVIGHLAALLFSKAGGTGIWWLLGLLPIAGILLTVAYQRFVVRGQLEHGTDLLCRDIAARRFGLAPSLMYNPIIASTITLGFGGSAGAEGPIAYAGAAMGSNIARLFGLDPDMQRIMVGCGAGAGIAGIFKAPVAGILFTLEVLKMSLSTLSVLALTVAGLSGALTCYILTGFTFDVQFLPDSFFDPRTLGWVALLGIVCGLYSVYYTKVSTRLVRFFGRIRNRWLRGLAGGAIVGACILLFPAFYGEGYGAVTQMINGTVDRFMAGGPLADVQQSPETLILMGLAVLMLKVFACIASNSAGGVAGDFTPTVFAGVFAGFVFAAAANAFLDARLPVGLFCLFGAAGAFAGIIHAPLMAIFLVAEIVGNGYGYILPLAVVSSVSYLIVKILSPKSRYKDADHDDFAALADTPRPR